MTQVISKQEMIVQEISSVKTFGEYKDRKDEHLEFLKIGSLEIMKMATTPDQVIYEGWLHPSPAPTAPLEVVAYAIDPCLFGAKIEVDPLPYPPHSVGNPGAHFKLSVNILKDDLFSTHKLAS